MNSFREKALAIVAQIPKGKVATYGQVARKAGSPRAARAVGRLMSTNTDTENIPCHRVVGAGGVLTGYAYGGILMKRRKLQSEGVAFSGGRVNLDASLWKDYCSANFVPLT